MYDCAKKSGAYKLDASTKHSPCFLAAASRGAVLLPGCQPSLRSLGSLPQRATRLRCCLALNKHSTLWPQPAPEQKLAWDVGQVSDSELGCLLALLSLLKGRCGTPMLACFRAVASLMALLFCHRKPPSCPKPPPSIHLACLRHRPTLTYRCTKLCCAKPGRRSR